jgi:hypothetical protein
MAVGSAGAVSARTTAPASVMTGAGGMLKRSQIPQPIPTKIRIAPNINIALDRVGSNLPMFFILA